MQVRIEGLDGDGLAITSLYRWLTKDPAARRDISVSLGSDSSEGTMGALDVIFAVLSQATGIATLAATIASWRGSRDSPPSIRITAGERSVIITGEPSETTDAIISSLQMAGDADRDSLAVYGIADEGTAARRDPA